MNDLQPHKSKLPHFKKIKFLTTEKFLGNNCQIDIDECEGDPCQNGGTCLPDGKCRCLPGWFSDKCEFPCPAGRFGEMCSELCPRHGNSNCDRVTGINPQLSIFRSPPFF